MAKNFKLLYSPLFYTDLDRITDYILHELKNEGAALALINDVEAAIKQRLANPLQTAMYQSLAERENPYRRILVGNYLIFYVVIGDIMIVRRMLYGRRDMERIL
ncbi:MAG TPA: type II toxin-antitoxin system RelE/ParE family toxin [Candidatus Saccharimonadales bacterium]|nr:type II toxin-antitoxin system RelE/ParE family toxin [Candidatus Saccharimonadales bacterium]